MRYEYMLVPLITILTGWLVGWLLIRLLFNPKAQTLFPHKQQQLATALAQLVSEGGFSFQSIEERMSAPAQFETIMPLVETEVDEFLRVKLPKQMPVIGMLIGERTINELKLVFIAELRELFPVVMKNYMSGLQNGIDPARLIAAGIEKIPAAKFEQALDGIRRDAARKAGLTGALAGLAAGILQVWVMMAA